MRVPTNRSKHNFQRPIKVLDKTDAANKQLRAFNPIKLLTRLLERTRMGKSKQFPTDYHKFDE